MAPSKKKLRTGTQTSLGVPRASSSSTGAELEQIFASAIKTGRRIVNERKSPASLSVGAAEVVTFVDRSRGRKGAMAAALREQEAKERRRFMSCKASASA